MTHDVPDWLQQLAKAAPELPPHRDVRFQPPESGGRPSAVLMLLGVGPDGPDLVILERATTMRSHAGQPAFPGGASDPGDDGAVGTALREAAEEVGLEPASVRILAELPAIWLPPSGFVVTPVLAWWHSPHPVSAVDPAEVATVTRVPVAELADPVNRMRVRHPSGYIGPAFEVRGMLVWGFTGTLVDHVIALGGWEQPWDQDRIADLPPEVIELASRTLPADAPRDETA